MQIKRLDAVRARANDLLADSGESLSQPPSWALPVAMRLHVLSRGNAAAQSDAARALRATDADGLRAELPTLRRALESPCSNVRAIAGELLARLGVDAAAASIELTRLLEDEDTAVRISAAQALCAANLVTADVVAVLRNAGIARAVEADVRKLASDVLKTLDPSVLQRFPASGDLARVVVGECSRCHRPLRVRARAVKVEMHLTCRCGASTLVRSEAPS